MKILILKIQVKDKIEAWKIVSHLGFERKVIEATFENKTYKFDEQNKPKDFFKRLKEQKINE